MNDLTKIALEWGGFSLCLLTPYFYGTSKLNGAICGIVASFVMIGWGVMIEIIPAWLSSIIFLCLHTRNLRIAINERIK